jgi:hypothetical protein
MPMISDTIAVISDGKETERAGFFRPLSPGVTGATPGVTEGEVGEYMV